MTDQKYLNLSVDCVIFGFDEDRLKVLLIEQQKLDSNIAAMMALPGDLVFLEEDLDVAANRVLKELTGLEGLFLKQFYTFGDPNRVKGEKDQVWLRKFRKNPEVRVITVVYYSLVKMEDYKLMPSSFAQNAEWVDIDDVPELGFDHNAIFEMGLEILRKDTLSNNIGFELLPKKFTLGQLQNLHEIIVDKKMDKRNFRKSIKKMEELIPLNEKQTGVFHKPAQLFSFERKEKD